MSMVTCVTCDRTLDSDRVDFGQYASGEPVCLDCLEREAEESEQTQDTDAGKAALFGPLDF